MREEVTDKLHQEYEALQSIFSSLAEGVIVADKNGKFLFFNPTAEKILGIGSKTVDSTQWSTVYGCYYPDKITPYPSAQLPLARALRNEKVSNELIFIRNPEKPDGVFIDISASPINDRNGDVRGGTIIFRDITDAKHAELKQKQSEERVRAQFKGMPIPAYVWQRVNSDFVLVDYNHAAEASANKSLESLLGTKLSKMFSNTPDIKSSFRRCYDEKRNISHPLSYRFQNNGEVRELIVSYVYVPPDLVFMHMADITERKQAKVELEKLSKAVEQTADSVVITDKRGIVEYVNPAFVETTGYSREAIIGQTPRVLNSGIHPKAFYKEIWKTILDGEPWRGTITNKKKNGEIYWCEQTITPMKDEGGNITNFVSVMKDITELREKQEQEFRLHVAHEVQQRLYNAQIYLPGFDVAGATYSAVETGGDYFDFIEMPDGYIGMVIGDVCGHGIGSALIMAATRAYLRAFAKLESDPGVILTRVNRELTLDLDKKHFVTLILIRIDPDQKLLDYASAGHVPAYVLDDSGKVAYRMMSTGIPLGIMHDISYDTSDRVQLENGNILALLTDGITEAHTPSGVEFGMARTLGVFRRHSRLSAQQIVTQLHQTVRSFANNMPQEDDITSIICKVTAK